MCPWLRPIRRASCVGPSTSPASIAARNARASSIAVEFLALQGARHGDRPHLGIRVVADLRADRVPAELADGSQPPLPVGYFEPIAQEWVLVAGPVRTRTDGDRMDLAVGGDRVGQGLDLGRGKILSRLERVRHDLGRVQVGRPDALLGLGDWGLGFGTGIGDWGLGIGIFLPPTFLPSPIRFALRFLHLPSRNHRIALR